MLLQIKHIFGSCRSTMLKCLISALFLLFSRSMLAGNSKPPAAAPITLTVTGTGADENDALLSAFRNAVRQGSGFYMRNLTTVRSDDISDKNSDFFAGGKVLDHKIVKKESSGKMTTVTAEVTVSPASLGIAGTKIRNGRLRQVNTLDIVQQLEHIESALAALSQIWSPEQADNLYAITLNDFKYRIDQNTNVPLLQDEVELRQQVRFSLIRDAYLISAVNTVNVLSQYAEKQFPISYNNFLSRIKKPQDAKSAKGFFILIADTPHQDALVLKVNEKIFLHLKNLLEKFPRSISGTISNESGSIQHDFGLDTGKWFSGAYIDDPPPQCFTILDNTIFIHPFLRGGTLHSSQLRAFPYRLFAGNQILKVRYYYSHSKFKKISAIIADKKSDDIEVTVSGWGDTLEDAKINAVKEGIGQAVGSYLTANSLLVSDTMIKELKSKQERTIADHRDQFTLTAVSESRGIIRSVHFFNQRQSDGAFICDAKIKLRSADIKEFLRQPDFSTIKTGNIIKSMNRKHQIKAAAKKAAMAIFRYTRNSIEISSAEALKITSDTKIKDGIAENIQTGLTLKINNNAYWEMQKTLLPLLDKYCRKRGTISGNKVVPLSEKAYGKWDIALITAINGNRYTAVYYTMPETFKSVISSCFYYKDKKSNRFPQSLKVELCFKNNRGEVKSRSIGGGDLYPLLIKENSIFLAPAIFNDKERAYRKIYIGMTCNFKTDDFKKGNLESTATISYDFDAQAFVTPVINWRGEQILTNRMPLSVYPTQMKIASAMNKSHSWCDWENAAFRNFSTIQKEYFHYCRRQLDGNNHDTNEYLRSIGWKHSGLGFIPAYQSKNGEFAIFAVSPRQKSLTRFDKVTTFNGKSFLLVTDLLAYLKTLDAGDTVNVQSSKGIFTVTLQPLESADFTIQ